MTRGQTQAAIQDIHAAAIFNFYLRAAISDCLLIGFIRARETLKKN
jgi:hypothetical protein